ncbi:MAG: hypothetical protein EBQ92_06320 [Proteobacteria bacterium]|nr:hypothetical protein [Pseudomonadota bacterium]
MLTFGVPLWAESRQEQRFQKPIHDLQRALNKKNPDEVLDLLIQNGNRSDLFELEALLRVYESEYPETLSGFFEDHIKPFEDELGGWVDVREALEFSKKVEAPKEVLAFLKGKEEASREKLKKFLDDQHLIGKDSESSPLKQLQEALEETDWSKKKKDRKFVLKSFSKLLKEITTSDYDMKLVEEGIHELRRDARWIPIYLRSFNDLFTLDDRSLPEAKITSDDPIFKSPYSKIPRAKDPVSFPILFPRLGFLGVNKAVEGLGKAKDIGKMEALLAHILLETGVASSKTQANAFSKSLVKKHPDYAPVVQRASALYRFLTDEERGLVTALRPLLKEQKDWKKQDCQAFLTALKK